MMRLLSALLTAGLLACGSPVLAGSVSGLVVDDTGAPMAGVSVEVVYQTYRADQLNGALLMYHSTEDQNVGTDPINSIKLFHALQGLGKTSALYMYPYEDHGPIAKETVLDQWARWVAWLDKYVKNANSAPKSKIAS